MVYSAVALGETVCCKNWTVGQQSYLFAQETAVLIDFVPLTIPSSQDTV